jgi:hypothetical protein
MLLVFTRFEDAVVIGLLVYEICRVSIIRRIEKMERELAHILSTRVVFDQVYMPWGQEFTIR